jgi:hypothetical protein
MRERRADLESLRHGGEERRQHSRAGLIGSAGSSRCRLLNLESLASFGRDNATQAEPSPGGGFDMESYIARRGFAVTRCKPWSSHPGGLIYELALCPFDSIHTGGSAAFTMVDGKPGFRCQHNGCGGKRMQDVFVIYPSQRTPATRGDEVGTPVIAGANWPAALKREAFYGIAGELVGLIEPHSEADPAALLIQFLVGFANLIGRKTYFMAEADRH